MAALARGMICLFCFAATLFLSGCPEQLNGEKVDNQSLVEIGELSLEKAESLEGQGDGAAANVAYRRALWAFRYHQKLTNEEPLLMGEALEGAKRTASR